MSETNYSKEEVQKLIDLLFEIARISARQFGIHKMTYVTYGKTKEKDHMKWITKSLKDNGWDTEPKNNSFGVLKEKEEK